MLNYILAIAIGFMIFIIYFTINQKKGTTIIKQQEKTSSKCESVNFHLTRICNFQCKFCFHTAKSSYVLSEQESKHGLQLLKEAGMKKINFSGGQPFTVHFLGQLVQYCKQELQIDSVSIVSNGSKITESWFQSYSQYLDILAISCDSFNSKTLEEIGRGAKGTIVLNQLQNIKRLCTQYKVLFKLNTVVNSQNFQENMNTEIKELKPYRWKVFQCLIIDGENAGEDALRQAQNMQVSSVEFQDFIKRHLQNKPVAENNQIMRNSYLILDQQMRFLNNQNGKKEPSKSILDVGVNFALDESGFDEQAYLERGGKYKWSQNLVTNADLIW